MKRSREELAWAAGFFDGEGHIGYDPKTYSIYLDVYQKGTVELERFARAVQVPGYKLDDWKRNGVFRLAWFNHEGAQAVFVMLWPFLCPYRRGQGLEVLRQWSKTGVKRRNRKARPGEFPCGHATTPENTRLYWSSARVTYLAECVTCARERWRNYYKKRTNRDS